MYNELKDDRSKRIFERSCDIFDQNYVTISQLTRPAMSNTKQKLDVEAQLCSNSIRKRDEKYQRKQLTDIEKYSKYISEHPGERGKKRYPKLYKNFQDFRDSHTDKTIEECFPLFRSHLEGEVRFGSMSASWANQIISSMLYYSKHIVKNTELKISTLPKQMSERTPVLPEAWRTDNRLNEIHSALSKFKSIPDCFRI